MFAIISVSQNLTKTQLLKNLTKTLTQTCTSTAKTTLPNLKPLNSKLSTHMKNGRTKLAQTMFDKMPHRNTVTYNAMIRGYFRNDEPENAIYLFDKMPDRDIFSYNIMIAGLMRMGNVGRAERVFEGMVFRDVVSFNTIISGYVCNGMVDEALKVFDGMVERDVVSWNLVISGLLSVGKIGLAENLFELMRVRDVASYTTMISAYMSMGRVDDACELFNRMSVKDIRTWNTMIMGCIKNECFKIAEGLFNEMPVRDSNSSNEMINGLVKNYRISDAIRLFNEMPYKYNKSWNSILLWLIRNRLVKEAHALLEKSSFSDIISRTNLIVGYFEKGGVRSALKVFEMMTNRDTTVWNATMCGLGENGHSEEGLKLYIRMLENGQCPNESTLTSVLTICSNLTTLHLGKQTHAQVIKLGFTYFLPVSNAMLTMYARCGNMYLSLQEFSYMPIHDVISWNSIISGYAQHGNGEKALEMFKEMQTTNVTPNQITFISVLSACSHAGLVDRGKHYFDLMKSKYSIQPTGEHYTCIVDLLGKYGLLNEAICYIDKMKTDRIDIHASVWGALLAASRLHKNVELGKIAGEKVLEIQPCNSGIYLILAEMYLGCGRREDAEKMWGRMREKGVKKQPGCSWIEINNSSHIFLSGYNSHEELGKICLVLDLLHVDMEGDASIPDMENGREDLFIVRNYL